MLLALGLPFALKPFVCICACAELQSSPLVTLEFKKQPAVLDESIKLW